MVFVLVVIKHFYVLLVTYNFLKKLDYDELFEWLLGSSQNHSLTLH